MVMKTWIKGSTRIEKKMSARSKLQLNSTRSLRLGNGQGEVCLAIEQMLSLSVPAAAVLRLAHKPALPWAEIGSFSEQEAEESIITNGTCCQSELRALVVTVCPHNPPAPCLHTPVLHQPCSLSSCWDLTSPQHLIHDLIFPKTLSTTGTTPHSTRDPQGCFSLGRFNLPSLYLESHFTLCALCLVSAF